GLTLVSAAPSQGSYDSATGLWTVGTVGTLLPRVLLLTARVDSSEARTNTATVSHSDQFDPDLANNSATAGKSPQQGDLQVRKTVDDAHPNVGDLITFTVTLTNAGPDAATNVEVADLLPGGLFFVSASVTQGNYDGVSGLWEAGDIASGAGASLR